MFIEPQNFRIQDYLGQEFECSCGRRHTTQLRHVEMSEGALFALPDLVKKQGYRQVFLVADRHTWLAAGRQTQELLRRAGILVLSHILKDDELVPNEKTMGELLVAFNPGCDLILAVGSGTLNDIGKSLSYKLGRPYYIVATAPSMDGYASVGAALIISNLKTTYDTHPPEAIIADLTVLANAPMEMIAAGVGDIVGKYTCLCDWRISNLINDEYHCPVIEEMVRLSIAQVENNLDQIKSRSPLAVRHITEALILTGIAMSFVGNSRPASGSEHHISHFWEMKFLFEGRQPVLHGTKVGIGTVAVTRLYEMLLQTPVDFEKARRHARDFRFAQWEEHMRRTYGIAAPEVIALEKRVGKNSPEKHARRIAVIQERWPQLQQLIRELLPPSQQIAGLLSDIGAPVNPFAVGVDQETIADSILAAKEVRDRYSLLQLLWDLGLSKEFAAHIAQEFAQTKDQ